jgi:lipoprotein-anchoring transpeptidase ErfK/SrfK
MQYTQQARPTRRASISPWVIMAGAAAAGAAVFLAMIGGLLVLYLSVERIPQGVSVAGLPIGGQSAEDAAETLAQAYAAPQVTLTDGDRQWAIPLAQLGGAVDVNATLAAAQSAPEDTEVTPTYTVDLAQAQNGLVSLLEQVNIDAVPGETPQNGRSLEIPVLLDRLRVNPAGELADGVVELPMIVVEPPPVEVVNVSTTARTTHIVEAGQELGLIARQYGVSVDDILALNDISNPDVIWVGQELLIPAEGVYTPTAADAPPAPRTVGKSILVSTSAQRIYAYENGQLVRSHLTSTGLPETPTVLGDYSVYVKYVADDMRGADYFLPQVPYTMYFYQGYGIHGTYWHNSFGRPMSHGCVNLPVSEAEWFFNWAEVGTPVRVI